MSPGWRLALFWVGLGLALVLGLVLLGGILLPFLVGMAAAYVLDPVADWLQRRGLGRGTATLALTVVFFAALVPLVVVLLPVIVTQAAELALQLPGYLEEPAQQDRPSRRAARPAGADPEALGPGPGQPVRRAGAGLRGTAVTNVLQSSLAVLNLISLVFITPIVTFYLLRDWDRMVAAVLSVVPPRGRPLAQHLADEIDDVLAGFLRGQGLVCVFLACFYAAGLALVGLQHGAIIGLLTGLFSFIPYVGMFAGVVVGLTVAVFQFGTFWQVAMVAAVFAIGQFIEGNFLTPRVVGQRIRLHPVWVIFAVLAGTALFGLAGTFLATPAAAVIAVLVRFGIDRWRAAPITGPGRASRLTLEHGAQLGLVAAQLLQAFLQRDLAILDPLGQVDQLVGQLLAAGLYGRIRDPRHPRLEGLVALVLCLGLGGRRAWRLGGPGLAGIVSGHRRVLRVGFGLAVSTTARLHG